MFFKLYEGSNNKCQKYVSGGISPSNYHFYFPYSFILKCVGVPADHKRFRSWKLYYFDYAKCFALVGGNVIEMDDIGYIICVTIVITIFNELVSFVINKNLTRR